MPLSKARNKHRMKVKRALYRLGKQGKSPDVVQPLSKDKDDAAY